MALSFSMYTLASTVHLLHFLSKQICITLYSGNSWPGMICTRVPQCSKTSGEWTILLTQWGRDKNRQHFADDIFKCIFFNENFWISIRISLKFVPKGPIENIPALVQIMGWRCPGNKPWSEPMLVSLPTHIFVTRPQWVNSLALGDAAVILN